MNVQDLQATVNYCQNSKFYQHKLAGLRCRIHSLKDFQALPFTTKSEIRAVNPLKLVAVDMDLIRRVHTSSGTKGTPSMTFYTDSDLSRWSGHLQRAFKSADLRPGDVFQNMVGFGMFSGGLGFQSAAEDFGLMVIPVGPGNTERQVKFMIDFEVKAFIAISNYIPILIEYMQMHGINPRKDLKLKAIFIGAEPFNPKEKQKWSAFFGVPILGIYGLSEIEGPGIAYEERGVSGMTVCDDDFYIEILDPESDRVLPIGCEGEIVITTLRRDAMPLLRFRTGDVSKFIGDSSLMTGYCNLRLDYVTHRLDDMVIIKGVNVFPDEVEKIVLSFSEIYNFFELMIDENDKATLRVSLKDSAVTTDYVENRLKSEIKKWLFINISVEWMPIAYFLGEKGKRISVKDNRKFKK